MARLQRPTAPTTSQAARDAKARWQDRLSLGRNSKAFLTGPQRLKISAGGTTRRFAFSPSLESVFLFSIRYLRWERVRARTIRPALQRAHVSRFTIHVEITVRITT